MAGALEPDEGLLLGRRREDELADEIELHLEHLTAEYVRRGLSPAEARLRARREFGGVAQTREAFRDQRRWPSIDTLFQDVRFATRALIKDRGTTLAAIALLTVGVGTTVVMADVLDRLLLRAPQHVDRPDLARRIYTRTDTIRPGMIRSNYVTLEQLVAGLPQEIEPGARSRRDRISMGRGAEARRLDAVSSTEGYFDVLGVKAALGQLPSTTRPVVPDGAAISHGLWQREFGGAIDIIGKPLRLGKRIYSVVAVMPRGFTGIDDDPVDLWLPLASRKDDDPEWKTGRHYFGLMGLVRLRPGVSRQSAEIHASQVFETVKGDNWGDGKTRTAILFGELLPARRPGRHRHGACAPADSRRVDSGAADRLRQRRQPAAGPRPAPRTELALKTALGATRLRLLRETAVEALLLAFVSGVAALVVVMTVGVLVRRYFLPPMAATVVPLDARLTLITVAVCTLWHSSSACRRPCASPAPAWPLRVEWRCEAGPHRSSTSSSGRRLRSRSRCSSAPPCSRSALGQARQDDFGLRVPRVVAAKSDLAEDGRSSEQAAAHERIAEALTRLPGVSSVAIVSHRPFIEGTATLFEIPGAPQPALGRCARWKGPTSTASTSSSSAPSASGSPAAARSRRRRTQPVRHRSRSSTRP